MTKQYCSMNTARFQVRQHRVSSREFRGKNGGQVRKKKKKKKTLFALGSNSCKAFILSAILSLRSCITETNKSGEKTKVW